MLMLLLLLLWLWWVSKFLRIGTSSFVIVGSSGGCGGVCCDEKKRHKTQPVPLQLGHLGNGPAMVFWSMTDLTRAIPANTPKPIASLVKTIRPIFDLLDHEPQRERERERERERRRRRRRGKDIFFIFLGGVNIVYFLELNT